jgi:hypothetical protein
MQNGKRVKDFMHFPYLPALLTSISYPIAIRIFLTWIEYPRAIIAIIRDAIRIIINSIVTSYTDVTGIPVAISIAV